MPAISPFVPLVSLNRPLAVLTAIRATGGRLTKRWSGPAIRPIVEPYGYGYFHTFYEHRLAVRSVLDLTSALRRLSSETDVCVIRGEPNAGQQLCISRNPRHPFRRTLDNFQESSTATWFCLDFDSPPPRPFRELGPPANYAQACAHMFGLSGVPLAYQLSGSCGIKHKAGIHFWGLLSKPLPSVILKRWYESLGADPALAGIVQPHYTAAPIFAPAPCIDDPTDREYGGRPPDPQWVRDPIPTGRVGSLYGGDDVGVDADAVAERFQADVDREREAAGLKDRATLHNVTLSRLNRSGPAPQHASTLQLAEKAGIVTDYNGPAGATRCVCPKHKSESGVSLHINADGEGWYCFGCKGGGGAWELATWILAGKGVATSRANVVALLKEARS